MPVQFRDYYETLSVSRTASHDEIRSAFRKLARQYHPDVAQDKKAGEAKFKEINEAYEVLGDPEKRRKYDELGAHWDQAAGRPGPGTTGGQPFSAEEEVHFGGTGFSDFFEAFFGQRRPFRRPGASAYDDYEQSAEGFREFPQDIEAGIMVSLEEALHGSTRQISLRRPGPSGQEEAETYTVKIPAGIREGQRIRLAGRGVQGGHLFLEVRFERHPTFRVLGADLYTDADLAPWEAVLGTQLIVPTLGGQAKLKIPAGTQNGNKFRLAKLGLPSKDGRGDLYVVAQVQVPGTVDAAERALWQQLAETSRFKPRD